MERLSGSDHTIYTSLSSHPENTAESLDLGQVKNRTADLSLEGLQLKESRYGRKTLETSITNETSMLLYNTLILLFFSFME